MSIAKVSPLKRVGTSITQKVAGDSFDSTGLINMSGGGLVSLELRPALNSVLAAKELKPTPVAVGVIQGLSLPIYNNDNEEIFFDLHIPRRWNESSDIIAHCSAYLDTANTGKNFKLRCSWENYAANGILPATSNDVDVETATGTAVQYQTFDIEFTIDYDIDGAGNELSSDDNLCIRLRRIAASANEIVGEVVITHFGLRFQRDKLGVAV